MFKLNYSEINLLKYKSVRRLFLAKWFPYGFQLLFLVLFIALAVLGWQVYPEPGMNDKLFAKTNIVTNTIWALWWPAMIWSAVLFSRAWCMICPLEFIANVSERLGRKLGIRQKNLSRTVRTGAVIVAIYAVIQLLVAGVHLHRSPAYTSFFLVGLLVLSVLVSVFYKDRAFCRGFCPVGLLLNTYGRGGIIALRSNPESCKFCVVKDCVIDYNRRKIDNRSCPSLLDPSRLNNNADCLLCGQCIKVCEPENFTLSLRQLFHPSDKRDKEAGWMVTIFIMLVSGFVTYELTTEWPSAKKAFLSLPEAFTAFTGWTELGGLFKGLWTIVIFPLILWLILGGLSLLTKGADTLTGAWRRMAVPLVIIISAGHMIKAVAKFISWSVYMPWFSSDPVGYSRVNEFSAGIIKTPAALAGNGFVFILGVILLCLSFAYAVREEEFVDKKNQAKTILPKILLFSFYLFLVFGIGLK